MNFLADAAFLLGPVGTPIIGLSCVLIVTIRRTFTPAMWVAIGLWIAAFVPWVTYWILWGPAFDQMETVGELTGALELAVNISTCTSAACCLALVLWTIVATRIRARAPSRR